jgi:hypothetical protein
MFLDGTFPNLLRKSFHVTVSDAEPCYHTRITESDNPHKVLEVVPLSLP